MCAARHAAAVLLLALGCVAVRGDEVRKVADDPDASFLEFLGSVDRLAEVNPDYLSQTAVPRTARPPGKVAPPPPPPPPPPGSQPPLSPQSVPPSASVISGVRHD